MEQSHQDEFSINLVADYENKIRTLKEEHKEEMNRMQQQHKETEHTATAPSNQHDEMATKQKGVQEPLVRTKPEMAPKRQKRIKNITFYHHPPPNATIITAPLCWPKGQLRS